MYPLASFLIFLGGFACGLLLMFQISYVRYRSLTAAYTRELKRRNDGDAAQADLLRQIAELKSKNKLNSVPRPLV